MVSDKEILELCQDENGNIVHYYEFLNVFARKFSPELTLELGTWRGDSSKAIAEGNSNGKVITVDINNELQEVNKRNNVSYRLHESLELIPELGKLDILFIDTEHDGCRPLYEFNLYKDYVKQGGVIFFDDIALNDQMCNFWNELNPEGYRKLELPVHFDAGFGCLIKETA